MHQRIARPCSDAVGTDPGLVLPIRADFLRRTRSRFGGQCLGLLSAAPWLVAVLLAGCADPLRWTTQWSRPGADSPTLQADLAECRADADELAERERLLEADAALGRAPKATDQIEPLLGEMRRYDTTRLYHQSVERCMRGKGYVPAGAAP